MNKGLFTAALYSFVLSTAVSALDLTQNLRITAINSSGQVKATAHGFFLKGTIATDDGSKRKLYLLPFHMAWHFIEEQVKGTSLASLCTGPSKQTHQVISFKVHNFIVEGKSYQATIYVDCDHNAPSYYDYYTANKESPSFDLAIYCFRGIDYALVSLELDSEEGLTLATKAKEFSSNPQVIALEETLHPGDSGSPVFNSDGDVSGIAFCRLKPFSPYFFN